MADETTFFSKVTPEFFGAFAGALFAFIFFELGEIIKKIGERFSRHYNALVKTEKVILKNWEISNIVLYKTSDLRKTIDKSLSENRLLISPHIIDEFAPDAMILTDLLGIEFINKCEFLFVDMQRINGDIQVANQIYGSVIKRVTDNNLIPDPTVRKTILGEYVDNIRELDKRLEIIFKIVDTELRPGIKSSMVDIRCLLEKKPFSKNFIDRFFVKKYIQIDEPTRKQKTVELDQELVLSQKKNEERLKKIYGI